MLSLTRKLLFLILPLCLVPLIGISFFSYFQAKERITEDRSVLYLEQIAQGVSDTIKLTLLEKAEETVSMGLSFADLLSRSERKEQAQETLNRYLLIHEVYDLVIVFDVKGRIILTNTIDRDPQSRRRLDPQKLASLRSRNILDSTPDSSWFQQVRSGRLGYIDWHISPLVEEFYDYSSQDVARHYSIGIAAPITDSRGVVVGGILSLMNWEYIQEILDRIEDEMAIRSLQSGYAFLFGRDGDTIIGHKFRRNRDLSESETEGETIRDNYGTSLTRTHDLGNLSAAVRNLASDPAGVETSHFAYEYPIGTAKISGLSVVDHEFFTWVCGVGINDDDIFAPVQELKNILIGAALLTSLLVVGLTYWAASQLTTPIKKLRLGASVIAGGDLSQRVEVSSRDEIGQLAETFNEMAESLEERSQALIELNRRLEEKVDERTRELQESHRQVEDAYRELKDAQVQLVQSEKMASLGQLVAGIAHEIKNPLNFIYGNTDFLRDYLGQLKQLIELLEKEASPEALEKAEAFKRDVNYRFMLGDLDTLVRNFEEGAKRIHSIIADLRAFSRMDTDEFRNFELQEPIELALNLLRHEYRNRIRIQREYADLPKIRGHSGKLSQVFMNILANACQAIPEEGEIQVKTSLNGSRAVVEIRDSGKGIEKEHIHRIFEPFFTTKPVGEGTGLGLSISYGIVQQHGGTIRVESRKDQGTTFWVELPVQK